MGPLGSPIVRRSRTVKIAVRTHPRTGARCGSSMNSGYEYREQARPRDGETVLAYLVRRYPHSTPETWAARIAGGEVSLDGRAATAVDALRSGQALVWRRPPWEEPAGPARLRRRSSGTTHLLAVAKPRGLPTMPAGGFLTHTLLHIVQRPLPRRHRDAPAGPRHVGRRPVRAHRRGAARGRRRPGAEAPWSSGIGRWCSGVPSRDAFDVDTPIGLVDHPRLGRVYAAAAAGKRSLTHVRVLGAREGQALVEATIPTGRPHQIRIHLAAAGHPLVGDPLYVAGGRPGPQPALPGDAGYFLHAHRLELDHPVTGEPVVIECAPPRALDVKGFARVAGVTDTPGTRLLGSIATIPDVPACALLRGARGVPALLPEVRMRSLPPPVARVRSFAPFVTVLLLTTLAAAAQAATLPTGFTETQVATGLSNPTAMAFAPDGRLFVCQQGGQLRVIKNGALLPTPFLTVTVNSSGRARPARRRLRSRLRHQPLRLRLLHGHHARDPQPRQPLHRQRRRGRGRQRGRAPRPRQPEQRHQPQRRRDALRPRRQALRRRRRERQRRERADPDQPARQDPAPQRRRHHPHRQPVLQPAPPASNRAIWALGLRNPFTFAFQPGTGRMFINDVGQNTWEEINDGIAGRQLRLAEHRRARPPTPAHRSPLFAYGHGTGATTRLRDHRRRVLQPGDRAVPGRSTSASTSSPTSAAAGSACFDPAAGTATGVRHRHRQPGRPAGRPRTAPSTTWRAARARSGRSTFTANQAPEHHRRSPPSVTVRRRAAGHLHRGRLRHGAAELPVAAQRRRTSPGATASSYTLAAATAGRQRRDLPRGGHQRVRAAPPATRATLTVTPTTPPDGHHHRARHQHALHRRADRSPTRAPAPTPRTARCRPAPSPGRSTSTTTRTPIPFLPATSGSTGGSFTIPTTGETATNVWYRIHLTVRDSGGLTATDVRGRRAAHRHPHAWPPTRPACRSRSTASR